MPIVNIPNSFVNGTPADANEVNENFQALRTGVGQSLGLDGGTLTGALTLSDNSRAASEARVNEVMGMVSGVQVAQRGSFTTTSTGNTFPNVRDFTFPEPFAAAPTVMTQVRIQIGQDFNGGVGEYTYQGEEWDARAVLGFVTPTRAGVLVQADTTFEFIVDWLAIGELA